MRHDTTTTPTSAPASTMSSALSARSNALKLELHCLYAQRAGGLEPGQDWGWCTACGRNSVFPLDGEDTCRACIAELTTDRAGRQP
jgi:hypothetical protein